MVEAMQLDIFKMVMENLNLLIFVAGVICFLTVVITQVTKDCRDSVASRPIYRFWCCLWRLPWWRTLPMWI